MCGRFAQGLFEAWSQAPIELLVPTDVAPRFNVAPSEQALVRLRDDAMLVPMRWGLVPSWAKDPHFGVKTFNARVETVAQKPTFREAFKKRRCVVPVDGFYEWQGAKGQKVPHFIAQREGPMLLAGLWEEGEGRRTFTVVTMEPNGLVAKLHDRMPLALDAESLALWFADGPISVDALEQVQAHAKKLSMKEHAVAPLASDGPECIEPAAQLELF